MWRRRSPPAAALPGIQPEQQQSAVQSEARDVQDQQLQAEAGFIGTAGALKRMRPQRTLSQRNDTACNHCGKELRLMESGKPAESWRKIVCPQERLRKGRIKLLVRPLSHRL
jgi:hypothetical protein